jgi:NADH-quinone oxidoreductase subunit N
MLINSDKNNSRIWVVRFLLASYAATAVLLYGISLYYSGSGSLSFLKIKFDTSFSAVVGGALVISALLFKVGVAPFHAWMIDIYEKASFSLIMFFDTIWKFFVFFIFIRFFKFLLIGYHSQIQTFLELVSVLSMIIGAIMPISQNKIKKFVAYSSVGHAGFVISVFAIANEISELRFAILYVFTYSLASLCFFTALFNIKKYCEIVTFNDLSGLMNNSPILGGCITGSMFAMIGIPPFVNFFAKLQILEAQIYTRHYAVLIVSIIYSLMSVVYTAKAISKIFQPRVTEYKTIKHNITIYFAFFTIISFSIFYYAVEEWFTEIITGI